MVTGTLFDSTPEVFLDSSVTFLALHQRNCVQDRHLHLILFVSCLPHNFQAPKTPIISQPAIEML